MSIPTHVFVTAPQGRLTPIHPRDAQDVGNRRLMVNPEEIRRVAWSVDIRRSWRRGDLKLCNRQGGFVETPEEAAAPDELEGGRILRRGLPGTADRQVVDMDASSRPSLRANLKEQS